MGLVAILGVALLIALPVAGSADRDAACRVFGSSPAQAPPAAEENPQDPATDQAQPSAPEQKQPENNPDETKPAKEEEKPTTPKPSSSPHSTSSHKRRARGHKIAAAPPDGQTPKVVIRQGGASDASAQIVPGITQEEAIHQREDAEHMLASTESNLQQLAARTLTPNQKDILGQIRQYKDGARLALKENDTQRAHTLALKAYLLADDLVKR